MLVKFLGVKILVFSVRESICGVNHVLLKAKRLLFKKPATIYLERYASNGIPAEPAIDQNGNLICCNICGFALIKTTLDKGWNLEMCSALPVISPHDPKFQSWFQKLAETDPRASIHS